MAQPPEGDDMNAGMGGPPETTVTPYTIVGTPCTDDATLSSDPRCTIWMVNPDAVAAAVITDDGDPIVTNVEAVTVNETAGTLTVYTSGIPDYQLVATQELIDSLNNRPLADRDFSTGMTSLTLNQDVVFAQDIGYDTTTDVGGCELGYWPPGPACPNNVYKTVTFPLTPGAKAESDDEQCDMGLGIMGLFVNGVSMYDWRDGQSYNDEGVWQNLANKFEPYDLDICSGHAAGEEYHHHSYSTCLQELLQDDGTNGHSPIVGQMPDGYFHYGLYQDTGITAKSCWKARNYSNPNDPMGCGGTGERTCLLVDNTDPSQGTIEASSAGPSVTEEVASLSSNTFVVESGFYYEDYYFDAECYAQGGEYLDEHNGHSHGDYGYHYHATETFPHMAGPDTFYGVVNPDTWQCGGQVLGPPDDAEGAEDGAPPEEDGDDMDTTEDTTTTEEADGDEESDSAAAKMTFVVLVQAVLAAAPVLFS